MTLIFFLLFKKFFSAKCSVN